ncbi:MAG: response regulator [Spirochaetaceae bacterium]|jgi:signal transduction histidine kinase/DNA-binding NarL/FixJ family response regulator/HPt (histidine-containing phosphotransfer) domain-containing protein|nr:response regulator [Spirochaetaceae bacterium]
MWGNSFLFIVSIIFFLVIVYTLGMLWFTDTRNRKLGGLFALGISTSFWVLFNAIGALVDERYFPFIFTIRSVALAVNPYCLFAFACSLNNIKWFKLPVVKYLIFILPALDILLIILNPLHRLFYQTYIYPQPVYANAFWVHYFFLLASWIAGIVLLFRHIFGTVSTRFHRIILSVASTGPLILNILFTLGFFTTAGFYYDVVSLAYFILFISFMLLSNFLRRLNIRTIGINNVLSSYADFYVVFSPDHIVIDTNMTSDRLHVPVKIVPGITTAEEMITQIDPITAHQEPDQVLRKITDFSREFAAGEITIRVNKYYERTFTLQRQEIVNNNRISGYTITVADVTVYRSMIKEIRGQNEMLKELKKKAEAASAAKSAFLANMSHEMRTPLNAIIGFSELELEDDGSGEAGKTGGSSTRNSLEKIYNSGMTLLGIINDILDISKVESGKFELLFTLYDVPSLVNDAITLNIVRIADKPVTFSLDVDGDLPSRLYGDELRIKQVLNNFLSNAFKYTKEGTVKLGLRCEKAGEQTNGPDGTLVSGVWLYGYVSDTGIGIKKEDMEKLFADYTQLDMRSNRSIEGTGLGLSITRQIIEMMKGSVEVKSEYGVGSTFSFRLLQGSVDAPPIGEATAESLKSLDYTANRRARNRNLVRARIPYARVLVVDDVQANLDVTRGMLKPYGMTVDCVSSGRQAVNLVRQGIQYNAIFMDHMMPEMDGIEAVRIIRNEIGTEYAKTVPIIALTANAIVGNEEMFFKAGFQAFLSKPIDIFRLNGVINHWVRDKNREKDLPPENAPALLSESGAKPKLLAGKSVPGVNLIRGLERFGDEENYITAIRSFTAHTPALLEELRECGPDLERFRITAHGIKGSSYGISADKVGKDAEALEHAAREGNRDYLASHRDDFIAETESLIQNFAATLESLEGQKPQKAEPDQAVLARIREAAASYGMGEMDRLIEELEQYSYASGGELVEWLRERTDRSELDEIAERLRSIQ